MLFFLSFSFVVATFPGPDVNKCKHSAIVFNATLANGYQSGTFVDHGDLGTMPVCQTLCCQSSKCDVAFMAGKRCFSVHCNNQKQCQWMPASEQKFALQLSYITSIRSIGNDGTLFNYSFYNFPRINQYAILSMVSS